MQVLLSRKKLLNFKQVKFGQILMGYKTYFDRLGHIIVLISFQFYNIIALDLLIMHYLCNKLILQTEFNK